MKSIYLFLTGILCYAASVAQSYQLPLDSTYTNPFHRATDLIGTKDVIVIYDDPNSNEDSPPLSATIVRNAETLNAGTHEYNLGTSSQNHRQIAVTTGDFNGDGRSEFAYAYEGLSQTIRVRMVGLNASNMQVVYSPEVSNSQTYPNTFDVLPYSVARLLATDVNLDGRDELLLVHRNNQDKRLTITLYGFDSGTQSIVNYGFQNDLFLYAGNYIPEALDAVVDDFDYDGVDELVVYGYGGTAINSTQFYLATYRLGLNGSTASITRSTYAQVQGSETYYCRLVNGDFNGDLVPEVAILQFNGDNGFVYIYRIADNLTSTPAVVDYTELTQLAGSSLGAQDFGLNGNYPNGPGGEDMFVVDNYPYYTNTQLNSIEVEVGDVNLDGKDDIIIGNLQYVGVWLGNGLSNPFLNAQYYDFGDVQCIPGPYMRDFIRVDDLNLDGKEEIIIARNERTDAEEQQLALYYLRFHNGGLQLLQKKEFAPVYFDRENIEVSGRMYALATGDFTGDGYSLGKPVLHHVNGIVQPIIVLNSPPVHSDNIGPEGWTDVAGCFDQDCSFSAQYVSQSSQSLTVESEVHSAWTVGASIGGGFNLGVVGVEAKLETTYGENFSNMASFSQTWTQVITATTVYDDLVYSSVTDYDVREYPVYQGGQLITHISSVLPKATTFQWLPGKSDDMINYRPKHESGNILSYRPYGVNVDLDQDNNETLWGETIYEVGPNVNYTWDVVFGEISSTSATTSRDLSISASLNASVYGVEAGLSGSYSMGSISTHSSSIEENISINVTMSPFNDGLADAPYKIYPYLRWSNNGAIELDYTVEPNTPSIGTDNLWSTYYEVQDPAWNLPWRLDTERQFGVTNGSKRRLSKSFWMTQFLNDVSTGVPVDNPFPGDTVVIHARIFNYSTVPTESSIPVSFYMGHPWNNGLPLVDIIGQEIVSTAGAIAPQEYKEVTFTVKLPEDTDLDGRIYGYIDPDSTMTEIHEENNLGWMAAGIYFPVGDEPSFEVGVEEMHSGTLPVHLYPNPARDRVTFEGTFNSREEVTVYVYNALGMMVQDPNYFQPSDGITSRTLSIRDLPAGLYYLRLVQGGSSVARALVVED